MTLDYSENSYLFDSFDIPEARKREHFDIIVCIAQCVLDMVMAGVSPSTSGGQDSDEDSEATPFQVKCRDTISQIFKDAANKGEDAP